MLASPRTDTAPIFPMKSPRSLAAVCGALLAFSTASLAAAPAKPAPTFKRTQVTNVFWSEGACVADFNHDGKPDFAAGPYWYEGPDFTVRHEFAAPPAKPFDGEKSYSDYFLA